MKTVEERFWEKVSNHETSHGCLEWQASCFTSGYGQFSHKDRNVRAHRFAYELEHGPIPEGMHVLHHCDNPKCVNVDHLFLGTNADNMQDKVKKGRQHRPQGELCGMSKLTESEVLEIREMAGEFVLADIAEAYGIARSQVSQIHTRKRWAHV